VPGGVAIRARWGEAARLIADNRDVLDARPGEEPANESPASLLSRGWSSFLLSLDDAQLAALEVLGHEASWPAGTPASLVQLARAAREVCAIPLLMSAGPSRPARRAETPRKRAQIDAFAQLIMPLALRAKRVLDVGSGHGHLTREIASQLALPVVGLERDVSLAGRARTLSKAASPSFAVTDVLRDGLPLLEGDCVIGLHACGDLGDAMVTGVARCDASIALVGCCLQKRGALSRAPLCAPPPGLAEALDLPRALLGLSNLTARDDGVEATRTENLAGRERRLALHRLLAAREPTLRLGAEIDGLNRRAAQQALPLLAARAFAVRGLPAPSPAAIEEAARWAHAQHARSRRLALPRTLLARALEIHVLLDRALYLEECGFSVTIGALFPAAVSARNLALVAFRS